MDENAPKTPSFRGLYRNVKISVKTLDKIIVVGIGLIVILCLFGVMNNGYTVSFDSRGGSDVPSQTRMYGELLELPEPPTREGYTFTGWYLDENCTRAWNAETDTVYESMTLYAGWNAN